MGIGWSAEKLSGASETIVDLLRNLCRVIACCLCGEESGINTFIRSKRFKICGRRRLISWDTIGITRIDRVIETKARTLGYKLIYLRLNYRSSRRNLLQYDYTLAKRSSRSSDEICSSYVSNTQVRSRLVANTAHRTVLNHRARASHVQALHHRAQVLLPARSGATVLGHGRPLPTILDPTSFIDSISDPPIDDS